MVNFLQEIGSCSVLISRHKLRLPHSVRLVLWLCKDCAAGQDKGIKSVGRGITVMTKCGS